MREWLEATKPAAPQRLHLLLAALMWSVVGTLLLVFGMFWVVRDGTPYGVLLVALAFAAGAAKARWILNRTAGRTVDRIRARGDGKCLGGFLSLRSWLFVAVMIGAGKWLRTGALPRMIVGLIYVAVGTALLLASRRLWRAWQASRSHNDVG